MDLMFWVAGGFLALMLSLVVYASWRDEFGRPWYHPWTVRGRHRMGDRRRYNLLVNGRWVGYGH